MSCDILLSLDSTLGVNISILHVLLSISIHHVFTPVFFGLQGAQEYKAHLQSVLPTSAKKCEIFSHKFFINAKQRLISALFTFTSAKRNLIPECFFFLGNAMTFFFSSPR